MSLDAYLKRLDWTGRQVGSEGSETSRWGVIPGDLQAILERPRIVGDCRLDRVRHFGRSFHRAGWNRRKRSIRRRSCRKALVLRHPLAPPGDFVGRAGFHREIFSGCSHAGRDHVVFGATRCRNCAAYASPLAKRFVTFGNPRRLACGSGLNTWASIILMALPSAHARHPSH